MEYSYLLLYALSLVVLTYAYKLLHDFRLRNLKMLRDVYRKIRKQSKRTFEFCEMVQKALEEADEKIKELEERL